MLSLARRVLESFLDSGVLPRESAPGRGGGDRLSLFVTLRQEGQLRGCIGLIDTDLPLDQALAHCAVSAANDPRFDPLRPDELDRTGIEVSILGGWKEIRGPEEIEVGRHGLMITLGGRRGLLLPQVAVEQRWNAGTFLEEVCVKAHLPRNAWSSGATVQAFTAEVFGDEAPSS
jgi:AmmeMemoRadiSam system protein A